MSEGRDLKRLGVFSQPSYLSIEDPYGKSKSADSRHHGKQFATTPNKRGKLDGSFDKFKPLFEDDNKGEKYLDPGTNEREYRNQEKKKIKGGAFLPSSPSKKATGPGAYDGCFGKQPPHEPDHGEKKKKPAEPKNILTSPGKRGTYGVPGITLGKSYKYEPDPYDLPKEKEKEEFKKQKKKQISGPFCSMSHSKDFFDSQPSVAASRIYSRDTPLPPEKKHEKSKSVSVPFKPSSPPKHGYNSTFTKFPEYKEDPEDARKKKEREERKKSKPSVVFKPVSNPHSSPTRPVMS
eukprot:gb/GECH01011660.1/.p1 GENE.gb/GECH01011660.1/~~gb/GECH01011660.1/.p1  ORF type:complete len:292 (+),score=88.15 gb/GECH01011660.1/:1-876(+)